MRCPQCGSTEIDNDTSRGDSACMQCGFLMGQNAIVSEVGFVEGANGASSVLGQFVASTGAARLSASAKTRGPGGRGPSVGYQKDSREHTIQNGRKHIQQVADHLRLRVHHVDSAVRLFMLAVQHNFIQGRRTAHVVAACLYIVCRREKTPHLLIDFSDVLQINLYVLGATFLKFIRLLNLSLPIIDPSLYIHRFAAQLELKDEQNRDKTHIVAMTALRLVARMKRDWILVGRRPSGVCGASLLIASRIHGFKRTQKEIIYIVRICDMTLRKRLTEFSNTQSSQLTLEEFEQFDVDLITNSRAMIAEENEALRARDPHAVLKVDPFGLEQDPPAFTRNRVAEADAVKIEEEKAKMRVKKEDLLKELQLTQPPAMRTNLLPPSMANPLLLTHDQSSSSSSADARDREIQAIQAESRQLLEANPTASDHLVAQIQQMMDGKTSEFAALDQGPQKEVMSSVDGGSGGTRVHVTPMGALDGSAESAAAAANASAGASTSALSVPSRERLKSVHKGPNLSHSRTRPSGARGATPAPSLLLSKDAPPNDLSGLFTQSSGAIVPSADNPAAYGNVGRPLADALAIAADPNVHLTRGAEGQADGSGNTLVGEIDADLNNWVDLVDFDREIVESILLTEEESAFKTRAWEEINKDYLHAQKEKAALLAAQSSGVGPDGQPLPRRQYKKKTKKDGAAPTNAAEAAMRLLAEKKFSDKINYNALQGLLSKMDDKPTQPGGAAGAKGGKGKKLEDVAEEEDDDEEEEEEEEEAPEEEEDDRARQGSKKRGADALELPSSKQRRTVSIVDRAAAEEEDDDEEQGDVDDEDAPASSRFARQSSDFDMDEDVVPADDYD